MNNLSDNESKLIRLICDLILIRFTFGLWVFVMIFRTGFGKILGIILFESLLVYLTDGWWLVVLAIRFLLMVIKKH